MAIIIGTSKSETLTGTAFADTISGGRGNDFLFGLASADLLDGGRGNDRLDGGPGNDTMMAGKGHDVYVVDSAGDKIIEFANEGGDTVRTTLGSYTLGSTLENLAFIGSGDFTGTGNFRRNVITGGAGNDTLDGEDGDDKLSGGARKDTAIFSGLRSDYNIAIAGGQIHVSDKNTLDGNDGTDTLSGVEFLQFKDGTLPSSSIGVIDLATLDGTNGFALIGIDAGDDSGFSVSSAGDVNGDGFADLIVGAPGAESAGGADLEGESYVVFGKASWAGTPSLDLATLDGTNGFRLIGIDDGDLSGFSVSSAGDVNGDGFADLIVGAPFAVTASGLNEQKGESYVVFGKANWAGTPSLDLVTLDGTNGFRLIGIDELDESGRSVSSAGDVNGDGFADLIVGAGGAESAGGEYGEGESYVVFGKASWAGTPSLDLAALDGTNGFLLVGIYDYDGSGRSVSSAGDVNDDGFADLIVGARDAESAGGDNEEGESYVVFGKASWAGTPSLDLAALGGTNGFRLIGVDAGDYSGGSVSSAGDVNGDGFADLIVGALGAQKSEETFPEGESYVVFGKASWAGTPSLDLATLDGTNGFRLIGIDDGDRSGGSVSSAGDVNGDGFADLIVGSGQGESYVVFGKASWAGTPSVELATLNGTNGFTLIGSGAAVSSAGDVNGDGFADLIIGGAGGANDEGESYVVFGGNFTGAVTHLGDAGDDTLAGTAAAETFVGGTGNDTMIGKGGADAFQGGAGDDTIRVSTLDFLLADGGSGSDTLELDGSGLHLDLTALADIRTRSIERIDIMGTGNNTLTLSVRDVLNLSEESNALLVLGDAGDVVNRGAGWTTATTGGTNGNGTSIIDGETFQIYTAGQAALLVDTDVSVAV